MTPEKVNQACEQLQKQLDASDKDPLAAKIITANDQIGARLRDMNVEQWEAAVVAGMEQFPYLTEAEVRNWFGRLSGRCDENDATWTE